MKTACHFHYPSKDVGQQPDEINLPVWMEESFTEEDLFIPSRREIFKHSFSRQKFIEGSPLREGWEISVTQLETLLRCPFRFYLERVEKLKVYNKPEVGESPVMGNPHTGLWRRHFPALSAGRSFRRL